MEPVWPPEWPPGPVRQVRIISLSWSPVTESNRRPSPYHGDALPTELTGPVFTCLTWTFAIRPRNAQATRQCTALVSYPGPASTPKLAGRASGTEHSAPCRYTSLAMGILRHVVRTPPGPRFHALGDRPVRCARRERRRDSPAGWPLPRKVTARGSHGRRGADACSGRLDAGLITAGDADPGALRGEPDGGGLAYAAGTSGDQNGLPGHQRGASHGSVLPLQPPEGSYRPRPASRLSVVMPSLQDPHLARSAPAQMSAVPGVMRGGTVLHRDRLTCRWTDMR